MVPDASTAVEAPPATDDDGFGPIVNGLLGGLAGVLLGFVPFSPVLGGAIAGYLEGGRPEGGLKVGAIAGLVMLVPFVLGFTFVMFLFGFAGFGAPSGFVAIVLVALLVSALYSVGLSVLGGYLGVYVENELENER